MAAPPASVAVVGLGLIGASLLAALRERLPQVRRIGVARRAEIAARALDDGLCDSAGTDPGLLGHAEVAVLCTPVDAMEGWLAACAREAPATVVTDCGSTKAWIAERGAAILGEGRFLGGHPMAGRERSGYDAAEAGLFAGCTWVVTPRRPGDLAAFAPWLAAVEALGAHLEVLDAATHDAAVAAISHLPFALSAALVHAAAADPAWPAAERLAASGFRDMARLAGGDPAMYAAIARTNAPAMLAALDRLEGELAGLRRLLGAGDVGEEWFAAARELRREWLAGRAASGRPVP
ncbi:MAG TPA: prephenate dehydrogenase/arogenate dehydrogenase family protein [Candidatus Dormibacteraeota bacterium]|nr:prephenate dehydrogenase/arogenate dehydrogenase family protein [Candidatus Dormibacteraeota bacterium]